MKTDKWEVRQSLLYGSEHIKFVDTEEEAINIAKQNIINTGNIGRITSIINNVVYYDIYEEEC